MFHSIRWRLILSYTGLTLLTVLLVGALALTLLRQYAERRAEQSLRANAAAIAGQAQPLLAGRTPRVMELQRLAVTAAFLGNVQVRILDDAGLLLVDSAEFEPLEGASLSLRPQSFLIPGSESGLFFNLPPANRRGIMFGGWEGVIVTEADETTGIVTIYRLPGMFGNRLEFERKSEENGLSRQENQTEEDPPQPVWKLLYGEEETLPPLPISNRMVILPIGESEKPNGFVELSGGPDFVSESLRSVRRSFAVAGLGAALLAVIVGLLVSRGLTAPILSLGEAARRMGEGELTTRAPVQSSDEIGQVAESFNQMAERLQGSFAELEAERDSLRRFVADASHELRTPITALKSFNELLTGPAANDPAAQSEFLAESAAQVERLEWITANLLDLSRLDGRLVKLDLTDHDLAELLEEATAPFHALAGERGIDLAVRPLAEALSLTCDRVRMVMALSNLLDNGLKYCAPGDRVEIGAEKEGGIIRLWVADSGPGIDEEHQRHIFERFYRGRTRAADGAEIPGSGLGLSIVASIVQAHGWRVRVESQTGQGTRFVIETTGALSG